MRRAAGTSAVRALVAGAIDYAGLFPPAALPMGDAVRNYEAYRGSDHAWALGRFVVPIARLAEFARAHAALRSGRKAPWLLSVLAGAGGADDWSSVEPTELRGVVIDAIELRARTTDDVLSAAARLPSGLDAFFEIPVEPDPAPLVAAVERAGAKAKVRTGGVTLDAFPRAGDLARFVVTCARAGVAFKATAGLHHPLRASYRLTYEPDSPTAEMFGFVNVLLAAAFARGGLAEHDVAALLTERDPAAIRFATAGVEWRGERVSVDALTETRSALALSFGSCSFREPIGELEALGLL